MRVAYLLLPLCLVATACSGPSETPEAAAPAADATPEAATPAPGAPEAMPAPEASETPAAPMPAPEEANAPLDAPAPADEAPKAKISLFNATCPGGIEVHADDGGPVFVNGNEASYKSFSESYYEARDSASGVTISVATNTDGSLSVTYTGKGGANGICTLAN